MLTMPIAIPIAVILIVAVWVIRVYNGLVGLSNRAEGAWSDIDVQLKRRHDLVENVVETVKGAVRGVGRWMGNIGRADPPLRADQFHCHRYLLGQDLK